MRRKEHRQLRRSAISRRKDVRAPSLRSIYAKPAVRNRYANINASLSSSICFDRLPSAPLLDVSPDGVVTVNPDNPVHQRWLDEE